MTVVIGVLAPLLNIEGALEGAATTYLHGLYPAAVLPSVPAAFSFNLESAGIAFAFVLAGVGAAYMLYVARRVEPGSLVGQTGVMHGLYRFLENRWYLNAHLLQGLRRPDHLRLEVAPRRLRAPRARAGQLRHGGALGATSRARGTGSTAT